MLINLPLGSSLFVSFGTYMMYISFFAVGDICSGYCSIDIGNQLALETPTRNTKVY